MKLLSKIKQILLNSKLFYIYTILLSFILVIALRYKTNMHFILFYLILLSLIGIEILLLKLFNKLDKLKEPKNYCLIFVVSIIFIFMLYTYNKTFSVAEGWYTTYARLILDGKRPYIDFELLYPPLYTYVITFFVMVFGTSIIWLRILGIVLFILIGITLYKIYNLFVTPIFSAIFALVTIFVMQSEIVQISYDYIIFYNLFNYLAIYFLFKLFLHNKDNLDLDTLLTLETDISLNSSTSSTNEENDTVKNDYKIDIKYAFIAGLFFSLSFVIRQNSGAINSVFALCAIALYIFLRRNIKSQIKILIAYVIGLLIPILVTVLIIVANGSFTEFINSTILQASNSKGGLLAVLFNWIPRSFKIPNLIFALVLMIISSVYYFKFRKNENNLEDSFNKKRMKYFTISTISIFFLLILLNIISSHINEFFEFLEPWSCVRLLCTISFVVFITLLVKVLYDYFTKKEFNKLVFAILAFSGVIFSTLYGSGTSGGLAEGQAALSYGFILMFFVILVKNSNCKHLETACYSIVLIFALVFTFSSISRKFITSYGWWGLNQDSYSKCKYTTDIEELDGILLPEGYRDNLNATYEFINKNIDSSSTIYCFPHIPIFYSITDIEPTAKAIAPWFDVASDDTVNEDLEAMKENKPDYIFVAYCDDYTVSQHEKLFRKGNTKSGQSNIYDWIEELKENNEGIVRFTFDLNENIDGTFPYYFEIIELVK